MEIGLVKQIDIDEEMRQSYLSYAMSVIVSRALPDARDGLKPVQRRILYAMYDMGLYPDRPHKKSARVVGEVLGKYHPHSDTAVYDAMVRMAQDFSLRYMLVDGQGNFGSIDGDAAAAMRYTEARTTQMGFDMLTDIGRDTVDFGTNFDGSLTEPLVLPASIPNLLVNGSAGIAVGIATSIPPHNLREVVDTLCYMLNRWEKIENVTLNDILKHIQGPDFPTGGLLFRYREQKKNVEKTDALTAAYATGRGRVTVRAKAHVEQMGRNKSRIVITELPYQTNKTKLISKIADLHRDGKIEGLTDLRDESDRNGLRIIIETTRNVEPEEVLAQLFKRTPLQTTFSIIMVALVNGEPRVLTLKQALKVYLDHRLEIVRRRGEYELNQAKERAHILEGLLIGLDNLDAIIDLIRRSRNSESARNNLVKKYKLTVIQATAILDMALRRLSGLERRKIQEEYKEKTALIKYLERLLSTPKMMRDTIKEELQEVKAQFGDVRRTQIVDSEDSQLLTATDLLPDEQVWVMLGQDGTLARTTSREMAGIPRKPAELPLCMLEANTQDIVYLFNAMGEAVSLPVYQLPQARELGVGTHWADLTGFTRRNHVVAAVVKPVDAVGFLTMGTLGGGVKRVRLEDLPGITSTPFTVMGVTDEDSLGWAMITNGDEDILMATANGNLIRFKEEKVRAMGLPAVGVMGIKLQDDTDGVVSMQTTTGEEGLFVWSLTDNGLAKATALDDYPVQGRYGQGVINLKLPATATEVVSVLVGDEQTEMIAMTALGSVKKIEIGRGKVGSRAIKPAPLLKMSDRNRMVGAVRLRKRVGAVDEQAKTPTQLSLLKKTETKSKRKRK